MDRQGRCKMSNIKCVICDLDGVLVEAREWHYEALNRALQEVAGTVITRHEHEVEFNGLPTTRKLDMLTKKGRVKKEDHKKIWERKQDLTITTIQDLAKVMPEKVAFHNYLKKFGFKSAVYTNAIRKTATMMLKMTGQLDFLDFIISNEEVKNNKPHPEGYIRAMIRLGCEPDETVIVEDSPIGKQAAYATGAHVWEVNDAQDVTLENFLDFMKDK